MYKGLYDDCLLEKKVVVLEVLDENDVRSEKLERERKLGF